MARRLSARALIAVSLFIFTTAATAQAMPVVTITASATHRYPITIEGRSNPAIPAVHNRSGNPAGDRSSLKRFTAGETQCIA
jgi:hypothetical protein